MKFPINRDKRLRDMECFIQAKDSFYSNFPGERVILRFIYQLNPKDDNQSRLCVKGTDDYFFTKDCPRQEARSLYRNLKNKHTMRNGITEEELLKLGFELF